MLFAFWETKNIWSKQSRSLHNHKSVSCLKKILTTINNDRGKAVATTPAIEDGNINSRVNTDNLERNFLQNVEEAATDETGKICAIV